MPEYLAPGVYIEEFELGPRPIEGVGTSTAGFLGVTERGPLEPRLVTGFEEFKRLYGEHLPLAKSNLPFAVDGFFRNGGQRLFIGRLTHGEATSAHATQDDKVEITAIGPGTWSNRIAVKIEDATIEPAGDPRFRLTVAYWRTAPPGDPPVDPTDEDEANNANRRRPTALEVYENLSSVEASPDFYEKVINGASSLIRVSREAPGRPVNLDFGYLAAMPDAVAGTDGPAGDPDPVIRPEDFIGGPFELWDGSAAKTGLKGFEQVDEIAIVSAPDHHRNDAFTQRLIDHCELLKDRFAVLHSTRGTHTLTNIAGVVVPRDSEYAAFYFPWIKVFNPLNQQPSLVPPSGHLVGIYARSDIERGVFKAPANEVVRGTSGLEFQITKREQDSLNPKGVNCIRSFPARGIRVWGARTTSTNSLWKYINVRRLFIMIEESIEEGTQWVVFEPNNERLWARVKQTITQFLTTQWRDGALMGLAPEEAFFVKVDRTTMTQDDIDNGRLICIIGIAPVKPAEFVIFRLTQFSGGSEVAEI